MNAPWCAIGGQSHARPETGHRYCAKCEEALKPGPRRSQVPFSSNSVTPLIAAMFTCAAVGHRVLRLARRVLA